MSVDNPVSLVKSATLRGSFESCSFPRIRSAVIKTSIFLQLFAAILTSRLCRRLHQRLFKIPELMGLLHDLFLEQPDPRPDHVLPLERLVIAGFHEDEENLPVGRSGAKSGYYIPGHPPPLVP